MAEPSYHTQQMREMPAEQRPRERLARYGEESLSNEELLAIILRTGTPRENAVTFAQRLITQFGGLRGLAQASISELQEVNGVGLAKAAQIKAALSLGRRLIKAKGMESNMVTSPDAAAEQFIVRMATEMQEQVMVMLLDTKHRIQRVVHAYQGDVKSANVRACEVFREAVRDNSTAIILAHNHPSGDPTPSPQDIELTRQIVAAGKLMDITVLDHLIIGRERYISLKERGLVQF